LVLQVKPYKKKNKQKTNKMEMTTRHFVIFGAGVLAGYLLVDYLKKNQIDKTSEQSGGDNTMPNTGGILLGTPGGSPYVPCNFIDGEIVDVEGWLNTQFPDYKFSISNETKCMGHSLLSNLELLDIEKTMTSETVQYKGKGKLKSASMVANPTRRDESVPIIYT
jgi:hypothetical protein